MKPTTLLVSALPDVDREVLSELSSAVRAVTGIVVAPVALPSAALIPQVLERTPKALAWAPSFVAAGVVRLGLGTPLVAAAYGAPRSAVLVAQEHVQGVADLAGRRIGWVSRHSVTGHHVPRLYLESFGIDVDVLFASQSYLGSHAAAVEALLQGEVDVVATHSGRVLSVLREGVSRLLVSIGPIPHDVVLAGTGVGALERELLARGLLAVGATHRFRFLPAPRAHFDLFEVLRGEARHHADVLGVWPALATGSAE